MSCWGSMCKSKSSTSPEYLNTAMYYGNQTKSTSQVKKSDKSSPMSPNGRVTLSTKSNTLSRKIDQSGDISSHLPQLGSPVDTNTQDINVGIKTTEYYPDVTTSRSESFKWESPVLMSNERGTHPRNNTSAPLKDIPATYHVSRRSKSVSSEWAWRPGSPVHTVGRTISAGRNIPINTNNSGLQFGHTNNFSWGPSQNRHDSTVSITDISYDGFGKDAKPTTRHGIWDNDHSPNVFDDAGLPQFPDRNVFGTIHPRSPLWPSERDSRTDPIRSLGYGNPTISSSLPSQTEQERRPTKHSSPSTPLIKGRKSKRETSYKKPHFNAVMESSIKAGILFRDQQFPAEYRSLYYSKQPGLQGSVKWKRPFDICKDPRFIYHGRDRFDVVQGQLGNCWLVSALAGLTLNEKLLERVCPQNQSFNENYCGAFYFRFWRFGTWEEVTVDDRLPTINGNLVYLHSVQTNEFWGALVEKAYAKVMGSYEALEGGSTSEAFTDFTGGIVESVDLRCKKNPWTILLKAFQRGSFLGCAINPTPGVREQELSNGLVCGHAYTITCIKEMPGATPLQLLRLRNPWGSHHEWNGAWSDKSSEWQKLPTSVREEIELSAGDDGEFWMSFDDFLSNFHTVDLCHLPPDSVEGSQQWRVIQKDGAWVSGVSAGGCGNNPDTFHMNPQFKITLYEHDDGDQDGLCTLIVSMTQKNSRKRLSEEAKRLTIGYSILKLPHGVTGVLNRDNIQYCETVGSVPSFMNLRDISHRHELPPGDYVIMPSTFKPHEQGEFLLRIYTEKAATNQEMDESTHLKETVMPTQPSILTPVERKKAGEMMNSFRLLAGEDQEIDAWELKKLVNMMFSKDSPGFQGFGIEAIRSMIAMHDAEVSGRLDKEGFEMLYNDLSQWKKAFKDYDVNEDRTLDSAELRNVFNALGFRLSNQMVLTINRRYCNQAGSINIEDFIMCACKLKTLIRTFQANQTSSGKTATFHMEEFITSTLYS